MWGSREGSRSCFTNMRRSRNRWECGRGCCVEYGIDLASVSPLDSEEKVGLFTGEMGVDGELNRVAAPCLLH